MVDAVKTLSEVEQYAQFSNNSELLELVGDLRQAQQAGKISHNIVVFPDFAMFMCTCANQVKATKKQSLREP